MWLITPELEDLFQNAPPWLASLVLHMCILIVLGLTILTTSKKATQEMQAVYGEKLGEQLLDNSVDLSTPTPDPNADKAVYSPSDLPPVNDPLATPKAGRARYSTDGFSVCSGERPRVTAVRCPTCPSAWRSPGAKRE